MSDRDTLARRTFSWTERSIIRAVIRHRQEQGEHDGNEEKQPRRPSAKGFHVL